MTAARNIAVNVVAFHLMRRSRCAKQEGLREFFHGHFLF
jgi:hypothetical protein